MSAGQSNDDFARGWLMCIASTVESHGPCTAMRERFIELGSPDAKECARLKLTTFDRKRLSILRKSMRVSK